MDGWNDHIVAEFRANNGYVRFSDAEDLAVGSPVPPVLAGFGESDGAPIILVHTIGARSGRVRITPVLYRPIEGNFGVCATYGGSPHHPSWYHNLSVNPTVTVEVRTRSPPPRG